jgi:pimeloyl-ACP methyl ester carboxylesterase
LPAVAVDLRPLAATLLACTMASACGGGNSMTPAAKLAPVSTAAGASGTIAYHVAGTGPAVPVVFIHSLGGSMSQWAAQLAHLHGSRRVVALDLRGHGQSSPPSDRQYTPEAMAADVAAVASALDIQRFVLVGHSYGGSVAVAVAGMHPDRVAGLFLIDANGDLRPMADDQLDALITDLRSPEYELTVAARWDTILKGASLDVRHAVLDDLRRTPKATVVNAFEAMATFDPVTPLKRYAGPTFAVVTPLNDHRLSLHRAAGLDHRLVLDTSHWPQMDKPDVVNAILDEFLTRVERRTNRSTAPAS